MNGILFFLQKIKNSQSGWSVTELLVASTLLILMTAALSRVYINAQQSFMFLQNNMDNTQTARQTINLMARDLRSTIDITAATNNSITYTGDFNGDTTSDNMAFTFTPNSKTLTRTVNGKTTTLSNGVVNTTSNKCESKCGSNCTGGCTSCDGENCATGCTQTCGENCSDACELSCERLFTYYDNDGNQIIDPASYDDSATSIKINLLIDKESNEKPDFPIVLSTSIQLRNLHERR